MRIDELWEERTIKVAVILVAVSLLLVAFRGITFGLELQGGSIVQLQTERALSAAEMADVTTILSLRLNTVGLKDIKLRPWGSEFIIVEIAGAKPEEAEKVIGKPGRLAVKIGNITAFTGSGLAKVESFSKNPASGSWGVPFTLKDEAALSFRDVAVLTNFSRVYMYMDEGTRIAAVVSLANASTISEGATVEEKIRVPLEASLQGIVEKERINITKTITSALIVITLDEPLDEVAAERKEIIANAINSTGFEVRSIEFESSGLVNSAPLSESLIDELARGLTVKSLVLEVGGREEDREEAKTIEAVLKSGALPVKVKIAGSYAIGPTLGKEFMKTAMFAGIGAMITVSLIIFLKYRKPEIILPIIGTGLSEVVMILGFASLINWNLDLPAIAGIIAAIGTGVDDQIVITDEVLKGRDKAMRAKMKSAFFIIMASWLATVAAMTPLAFLGVGSPLMGFAITTVAGVTIGVFITRPAYATLIQHVIKK